MKGWGDEANAKRKTPNVKPTSNRKAQRDIHSFSKRITKAKIIRLNTLDNNTKYEHLNN